ncbi:MAG: GNAT family N-acetyltransferase [Tateyamaria sp.]|uniref:GNAT family N-acetyltransferase n=1 Tax=Tateyamaria sp. TaxID=1929288 RepID=UPI00329C5C6F
MDKTPPNTDFAVKIAAAADLSDLAVFLSDVFSKHEPPAVAAGFPVRKIEALATVFGAKSIQEKLSVVARAGDTGKIIGVALAHDFGTPPSSDIEPLIPIFEPLLAFLEGLEEKYLATKTIEAGNLLHVFMIGVDESWSGNGIAQKLLHTCIANSASHDYKTAFTEATSERSRHVFRSIGFQEQHFAAYEDFVFQGSRPFASIQGHKGCALMDMKISS